MDASHLIGAFDDLLTCAAWALSYESVPPQRSFVLAMNRSARMRLTVSLGKAF